MPWQRYLVASRALARTPGLPVLLAAPVAMGGPRQWRPGDVLAGWGRRPVAERQAEAARHAGLPFVCLEDGFLRSIELGHQEPPLSVVLDPVGIYYDATRPSYLETLVRENALTAADAARAANITQQWRAMAVSKYNAARNCPPGRLPDDFVLVVDQTWGDASIRFGCADAIAFERMLEAALDEHPNSMVVVKVHPDVIAGAKRGHYDWRRLSRQPRVQLIAENWHLSSLLPRARAVYCVTSQTGFEALLWARPVRCFGMPFYAGWGLTQDELKPPPLRRSARSLEALVHASLVVYPRYRHPETGQRCEVEQLLEWTGLQRRMRERFPEHLCAQGFSLTKRPVVRQFLQGSQVRFEACNAPHVPAMTRVRWGRAEPDGNTLHLEDGFLRSVGLGADLVRPVSWVIDRQGLYFDATRPSDLETLLQHHPFTATERARGRRLLEMIVANGLTKYNVGDNRWQRPAVGEPVLLVVGQVETDASLAWGAPEIRTNMALLRRVREQYPLAHVVYKPHPDVVAGLRRSGDEEASASQWCDQIVRDASLHAMLPHVDHVHTLTSLAGFEALLRGKPVSCHGMPFYAGWGLTHDLVSQDHPSRQRRRRHLSLEELVAGALVLYPTYVSRVTGRFTTAERAVHELLQMRTDRQTWGWLQHLRRWLLRQMAR